MAKTTNKAAAAADTVTDQEQAVEEVTQPPEAGQANTHTVRAMSAKGFWRAGRFWPPEETPVFREDFTDEQWQALESEPAIAIKSAE